MNTILATRFVAKIHIFSIFHHISMILLLMTFSGLERQCNAKSSFAPSSRYVSYGSVPSSAFTLDDDSYDFSRPLLSLRKRNCPSLRNKFPNGWVKISSRSRNVRFSCNTGFRLIGSKIASCVLGKWDRDLPVCVSSGCAKITAQPPLKVNPIDESLTVVDLSCALGYYLNVSVPGKSLPNVVPFAKFDSNRTESSGKKAKIDDKVYGYAPHPSAVVRAFCVSRSWRIEDPLINADLDAGTGVIYRSPLTSEPSCAVYEKPIMMSMNCDFEESICGWFQDNDDDFDWQRNRITTSFYSSTGPSFDHTYGTNKSGFYLYLGNSYPRTAGDIARLYSPVYQHENKPITDACFEFYYHMFGSSIGSLRVYVLEQSQTLKQLRPFMELVGDQGDQWQKAQIELNARQIDTSKSGEQQRRLRPFQIVFEGVLGHGYRGDISIDDIRLVLGKNCTDYNSTLVIDQETINDLSTAEAESGDQSDEVEAKPPPQAPTSTPSTTTSTTTISSSSSNSITTTTTTSPLPSIGSRTNFLPKNSIDDKLKKPIITTKNGTSVTSNRINSIIDQLKSVFNKAKKPNSTPKAATSSSVINDSSSSTTPTPTSATSILSSTQTSIVSSPRPQSPTTNTVDAHSIQWWSDLRKRLKETTEKQQTQLNGLRNLTTTTTTTTTIATTTVVHTNDLANISLHDTRETQPRIAEANAAIIAKKSDADDARQHRNTIADSAGSSWWTITLFIGLLTVIGATAVYFIHANRLVHARWYRGTNLDMFVASFARKVLRGNGGGYRGGEGSDGIGHDDDGELLVTVNSGSGMHRSTSGSNIEIDPHADLMVYDNANTSDGVVYLQTTHSVNPRF